MKYKNTHSFDHSQSEKIGILVTNLGTPNAPTAKSLKPYLKQFLSDPRVVEFPRALWWLILNGVILNIRPQRSAKAYARVWTDAGSPLALHTQDLANGLSKRFSGNSNIVVDWAMRYGNPSIQMCVDNFMKRGVTKLLVLPLYPHYSGSTVGSTFDAIADDFKQRRWIPELRFISGYHDFPPYIDALAKSIRAHWEKHGRAQMLIFSYHGIPQRYFDNGDPYHCTCYKTTRLVAEQLGLSDSEFKTTFQSRFGREPWLQPYTDVTMKKLAGEGVKSVQVICPGFSADCLETLEEIDMENREYFLEAGGEKFTYIPALNSCEAHVSALEKLIENNLGGWRVRGVEEAGNSQKLASALMKN